MKKWNDISDIRREYGFLSLNETEALDNPFSQFELWFEEGLKTEKSDPTAMVLSTIDEKGHPDSRVVLLKGVDEQGFVFFTNYHSAKAKQLALTPFAALNFYWPQMARQVRVRGQIKKTTKAHSDVYFASRPVKSQLSAIASPQSSEINGRENLEQRLNELILKYQQRVVVRPVNWGGYILIPVEMEFWQGRDNRLHDRIHYFQQKEKWVHHRLAP